MLDSLATTATSLTPTSLISIFGPIGGFLAFFVILFKDDIRIFLRSFGKQPNNDLCKNVEILRKKVEKHEGQLSMLERASEKTLVTISLQHEQTLGEIGKINDHLSKMMDLIFRHIDGDKHRALEIVTNTHNQ